MALDKKGTLQDETGPTEHDRLLWYVLAERRRVLKRIEFCIGQLEGMRAQVGSRAVDPLLRDYKEILELMRAGSDEDLPARSDLARSVALLQDLGDRLATLNRSVK